MQRSPVFCFLTETDSLTTIETEIEKMEVKKKDTDKDGEDPTTKFKFQLEGQFSHRLIYISVSQSINKLRLKLKHIEDDIITDTQK